MSEHIEVGRHGPVQTVRMNRPDKKNAITRAMYGRMAEALLAGDADGAVRVQVLLGVPGAFCAGNDLSDFMTVAQGGEGGNEVADFLHALASLNKPLLSAVDGIAVGIGATIQFHCDLTYATPRTEFRTPFLDLGITPEAGSTLLGPAILGRQGAFAMLALGEGLGAEAARAAGFIHAVVSEADLEPTVLATAERLAQKPPEALKIARDLMLGDRDALRERIRIETEHFRARLTSHEAKAALAAFMNRKRS